MTAYAAQLGGSCGIYASVTALQSGTQQVQAAFLANNRGTNALPFQRLSSNRGSHRVYSASQSVMRGRNHIEELATDFEYRVYHGLGAKVDYNTIYATSATLPIITPALGAGVNKFVVRRVNKHGQESANAYGHVGSFEVTVGSTGDDTGATPTAPTVTLDFINGKCRIRGTYIAAQDANPADTFQMWASFDGTGSPSDPSRVSPSSTSTMVLVDGVAKFEAFTTTLGSTQQVKVDLAAVRSGSSENEISVQDIQSADYTFGGASTVTAKFSGFKSV